MLSFCSTIFNHSIKYQFEEISATRGINIHGEYINTQCSRANVRVLPQYFVKMDILLLPLLLLLPVDHHQTVFALFSHNVRVLVVYSLTSLLMPSGNGIKRYFISSIQRLASHSHRSLLQFGSQSCRTSIFMSLHYIRVFAFEYVLASVFS